MVGIISRGAHLVELGGMGIVHLLEVGQALVNRDSIGVFEFLRVKNALAGAGGWTLFLHVIRSGRKSGWH